MSETREIPVSCDTDRPVNIPPTGADVKTLLHIKSGISVHSHHNTRVILDFQGTSLAYIALWDIFYSASWDIIQHCIIGLFHVALPGPIKISSSDCSSLHCIDGNVLNCIMGNFFELCHGTVLNRII